MQAIEQKKIVIQLPNFRWKSLLTVRFFIAFSLLFMSSAFVYWAHSIRPYLWISSAHLNALSTIVCSDACGRIAETGPQEGDLVKKGQLLFSLDRDLILAKYNQAKLSVDDLNRQIELEKGRMGKAMEAYLTAANELELGIGTSENVQKQLILMEESQGKSEAASSKIGPLKAELNLLEAELKKTACLAPFDGIVLKRFNQEGSVVSFGDAIYTLCDPHRVWVEAEVRETDIGQISIGTPARIHFNAYPKKEWTGFVSYIGAATVDKSYLRAFSDQKAMIPIKISIENIDASLKPGLSARVDLKIR